MKTKHCQLCSHVVISLLSISLLQSTTYHVETRLRRRLFVRHHDMFPIYLVTVSKKDLDMLNSFPIRDLTLGLS